MTQNAEVLTQTLPTNVEELHAFIVKTLTEVLAIPENTIQLAQNIFAAAANATQVQRERDAREQFRPVLTRTPYPGCLRALVTFVDETFVVSFGHIPDGESDWELCGSALAEPACEALTKLVLSQPVFDGDIWYVTTNAAVNAQLEKVTDVVYGESAPVDAPMPEPMDLDQVRSQLADEGIDIEIVH
jgi:hypothetical protein